jgi:hypothetical protein
MSSFYSRAYQSTGAPDLACRLVEGALFLDGGVGPAAFESAANDSACRWGTAAVCLGDGVGPAAFLAGAR